MDLKEFISETVSAIFEATSELQKKYESQGAIVNPPISFKQKDIYSHESSASIYRRIEIVEFDVAVSAETDAKGGGKAGLRVFSVEANLEAGVSKRSEAISRVRFAIPIVLTPSETEMGNKKKAEAVAKTTSERRESQKSTWLPRR